MRKRATDRNLLLAGLMASVLTGLTALAPAQEAEPLALAPASAMARSPKVKSLDFTTAICWVESGEEGNRRIRNVVLKDGRVSSAQLLAKTRTISKDSIGGAADLDLSINPEDNQPGIVWIRSIDDGNSVIFGRRQGDPVEVFSSSNVLELPVIEYDGEGNPYVAWSEIAGGQSRVYAARLDDQGNWVRKP